MERDEQLTAGADRLSEVPMSRIRVTMNRVRELEAQGIPVISLSAGEPDFPTPEPIKNAVIQALEQNHTHYAANLGQPALRSAIAQKYKDESGIGVDWQKEILITCGGAEALNNAVFSTVNPGDEVILFRPAFVNYEALVLEAGGVVADIELREEEQFQIPVERVKKRITEKTKLLILNNPQNPTGTVHARETLRELAELAKERHFLILSDEIYDEILYEGAFTSMLSFPEARDRCMVVNGFSKTYAMTGFRLGYVIAPQTYMEKMVRHHQFMTTCIPTFIQDGAAAAMNLPATREQVACMTDAFCRRRQLLTEMLGAIEGLRFVKPAGAFYLLVNVSDTGLDGDAFAERLLQEEHVAVIPGSCFGKSYAPYIRISFAASEEKIKEGLERLAKMVCRLKQEKTGALDTNSGCAKSVRGRRGKCRKAIGNIRKS